MKCYPNIEKSAFRPGEYIGYAASTVWRITKLERGWRAHQVHGGGGLFTRRTLAAISAALEFKAQAIEIKRTAP